MHILLWLVKDTCWLLQYRMAGTIMIFPTLLVALWLTWSTRKNRRLFLPNLGVTFWISANITWMLGEFYEIHLIIPALIFFSMGILSMLFYFSMTNIIENKQD